MSTLTSPPPQWHLELCSPAKVNLFLRIIRKRPDGYHELASLFQAISVHDTIKVTPKDNGETHDTLFCDAPGVPLDRSNLIIRAFEKYREKTGAKQTFYVKLDKRVPVEAGLGGGSANAATALWAANKFSDNPVSDAALAEFGAEFGSDISFFFSSGTAYCTGRGEILHDQYADCKLDNKLYIVKPKVGLSTRLVFQNLDAKSLPQRDPLELLRGIKEKKFDQCCINDLEVPSFTLVPMLAELKHALQDMGFESVLMSGSGTAFFALGEPKTTNAAASWEALKQKYNAQVIQCRFINRQPGAWFLP